MFLKKFLIFSERIMVNSSTFEKKKEKKKKKKQINDESRFYQIQATF